MRQILEATNGAELDCFDVELKIEISLLCNYK